MKIVRGIIFVILGIVAVACTSKRNIADGEKIKHLSLKNLKDSISEHAFTYEWMKTKASATIGFKDKEYDVKLSLRMRKDSAAWVHITKAKPLLTSLVSQDSVKFLLRYPEKQYFLGEYGVLSDIVGVELSYELLQDYFEGKAVVFDEETKYKTKIDNGKYLLSSEKAKRLDRMIRRGRAGKSKVHYKCWIDPSTFKCTDVEIAFPEDSTTINIGYSNWKELENQLFPMESSIAISSPADSVSLHLKYGKFKMNVPQSLPLKVTDSYSPYFEDINGE